MESGEELVDRLKFLCSRVYYAEGGRTLLQVWGVQVNFDIALMVVLPFLEACPFGTAGGA